MKSKYEEYEKNKFQKIISESTSVSEILRKIGLADKGYNHTKLTKFLKDSDYDTSTIKGRHINKSNHKGKPKKLLSEILCENSTGQSDKIKKRLLESGVKVYKCENPECGVSEWHGMPIQLQLHHINGNHFDNRLENLVLLCPNCHSQTSNFGSKNSADFLNKILSKVAIDEAKSGMENLLKFEKERQKEIEENRLKWEGDVGKRKVKKDNETIYCKQCGKEIKGRGKIFCCVDCMTEYQRSKKTYGTEDIVQKSYDCSSFRELGRLFNITDNAIKKRLRNAGMLNEVTEILKTNKKDYSVLQYSVDGDFIKRWESGLLAAKTLNINKSHLYLCCNYKQKTCGGYVWRFEKEEK